MAEQMQYVAKLGIDDGELLSGLEAMTQKFDMFFNKATIGLAAVAAAAVAVEDQFWKISAAAHEMEEFSAATGMSVESLQKFQYAAAAAGESVDWYNGSIQKLLINMGKATDATSEQAEAFRRLGVDPTGKSVDQVYVEVFQALQNVNDATERSKLTFDLLGKSVVEANIQGNHYIENLDAINGRTYLTAQETKNLADMTAMWNKGMADSNLMMQRAISGAFELTEKYNFLGKAARSALSDILGLAAGGDAATAEALKAKTSNDARNLINNFSAAQKQGMAEQLKYLNDEYNAGNLTVDQYNAKRMALTGTSDLKVADAVSSQLSTYTGGSTGWDQGMVSGNQYWAAGVQPNMGVMGSPTQANAYQLGVASTLYSKYYDQLTGDKWGPQKYREEIARQMAYNEAAKGFKSQEEAWAASGYNPTGNITVQIFSPITTEEAIGALSEEISRAIATKMP